MTKYRRIIAYRSDKDRSLPVIFNDYNQCLDADPTTEKELPVIDAAKKAGAEIFCMDAGWYADGTWWETVGEWVVCKKRFPNGLKEVFDYIRSKDMLPGIWVEPEVMGIGCPTLKQFDDDCFFMRHGKRVIDHGRFNFDFRAKKVRDFLDQMVDGLISDYGIGYFKFDYNIDGGIGTDVNADSFGDGLFKHHEAYFAWIDGIYQRHPDLIIENCASGGMRMDYRTLRHFSLQSLTDNSSFQQISCIATMSQTAVIPEQAAVWCIPKCNQSDAELAFVMVNAMFRRIHLSGETHRLLPRQMEIISEGVALYKSIRDEIPKLLPFYPLGIVHFESEWVCCGYKGVDKSYICMGHFGSRNTVTLELDHRIARCRCLYPKRNTAEIVCTNNNLSVSMDDNAAVVIEVDVGG